MIKKFTKDEIETVWEGPLAGNVQSIYGKINELCDIINTIQKEREAERFEIQAWISIIESVRESVNINKKQICELQTEVNKTAQNLNFARPEVKENFTTDPYAEQRRWIGKLCRFWDEDDKNYFQFGILGNVGNVGNSYQKLKPTAIYFDSENSGWWEHCEPVLPTDSIIYKGSNNE